MITLDLQDYCHEGCMRFEPRVTTWASMCDSTVLIACEHAAECKYIMKYLKEHTEKEKKE